MTLKISRIGLLNGATLTICGTFAAMSLAGSASAQASICTLNSAPSPDTFTCNSGGATPVTAAGTASDGAVPTPTDQGLSLTSTGPLTVTLSGQIVTTEGPPFNRIRNVPAAVSINYLNSSPAFPVRDIGAVIYTSTGTTISEGNNTLIRGTTVTATTGTVIVNGANAMGVFSVSTNGLTIINGGTTTLANPASTAAVGIFSRVIGGANVVNTGVVTVAGVGRVGGVTPENLGVRAVSAASSLGVCGSTTVNVTGNVTVSNGTAISTDSCGASTVNVDAGRTVRTTTGTTILNTATSAATTNVSGTVDGGAANIAIDANGTSSATIVAATGAVIGRFDGTGGADIFTNNGAFTTTGISDFQAGADVFTNNGTLTASGATTFAGLETLANAGTISLMNGATGDVLTLAGNYSGTGAARLLLDVSATGADRIVIGGAASGSTSISLNRIGGAPSINTSGLLLIDAGSATAGAFTLIGNGFSTGLVSVTLEQRGAGFFLVARPDVAAIEPVVVGDLAQNLWYQSADIYSNYIALRRSDLGGNRSNGLGVWGQVYYSQDRTDRQDVSVFGNDFRVDRIKTKRRGAQAGVDYLFGSNALVGITGGYERAEADIRNSASDFRASGYNIGGYAMLGGGSGFYGDALVKYDRAKLRFDNPLFDSMIGNPRLKSFGAQGQVGYRFGTEATTFDLGAGIAFVKSRIDNFSVGTIAFDFDRVKSTRGHLGARATFGGGAFSPFVDAKVYHEFDGDTRLGLLSGAASDRIASRGRGTWGRVEAGIGAQNGSGPILAAWGDFGDVRGFGAKAAWRFGGAREAIALTPPPPMAPATQTCADGLVMLATDICPSPPSPPPPPAPEAVPERG